jgi:aspartyl-tRNA synthetase
MKNSQLRKYFSNLIYQGTILNNRKIKKYLNKTSFEELLKVIRHAFNNFEESENNNCVYLTSSLFIYYRLENNNFYYLYEDFLKLNAECKLWNKEAFWTEWFNYEKNQEENNTESNHDDESESDDENKEKLYNLIDGNKSKIYSMIENMYEISNKLKINENIIKEVIINKIASENLSNDEFREFQVSVMGLEEEDL